MKTRGKGDGEGWVFRTPITTQCYCEDCQRILWRRARLYYVFPVIRLFMEFDLPVGLSSQPLVP